MKRILLFILFSGVFSIVQAQSPIDVSIHNHCLDAVYKSFPDKTEVKNLKEANQVVVDFLDKAASTHPTYSKFDNFKAGLEANVELLNPEYTMGLVTDVKSKLYKDLEKLDKKATIAHEEYLLMLLILADLKECFEGKLSIEKLRGKMTIWAEKEKALPANKLMTGVVVAIAFASDKWWTDNPDAGILGLGIPALDAAGAVVGAVGAVVVNGSNATPSGIAGSAVYGAVAGSVGAVGKIAKFFEKLFK